ncbi:MAG TPA: ABC transporter substrate-binding protein [Streptosporangiaceae bacterium]
MSRKAMKVLALAAIAAVGVAACGNSSGGSSQGTKAGGKTLVIEGTPLSPMTDDFNPFDNSGTGFVVNSIGLVNEPLYIFNNMVPTQKPNPMLASGQPTWSADGKSVTIPIRTGVKWNDGKAFTASDVAYTFNMLKANPKLFTSGAPVVTSATASSATSVTLNFATPQIANFFAIAQVYIVPQHVWSKVSDPSTYSDAAPVGTGPYELDHFSPQGFTLKQNPGYWNKASVKVPEISFPAYNSNFNLVQPVANGQIDWAGNDLANIKADVLDKSPQNHTYLSTVPYFADNNVVGLVFNTTKKPLNDPAVRQAISLGINRQQLSVQGETSYEPPATSSGGLMLPTDNSYLTPSLANDLPSTGDAAKLTSVLTADGWKKVGGKWTKGGQTIKFSISDPVPYTDYYTDAQLIARSLNAQGMDVTVDGIGDATTWAADYANGTFDTAIHWSNQGPNPYFYYDGFLDSSLSAPVGKPAAGDNGRYSNPAVQAALAQFAGTTTPSVQAAALTKLQAIMSTEVPVAPLLYGGAWSETSTRNYTGWPTPSNPYMSPQPTSPYLEYTVLHLKPAA